MEEKDTLETILSLAKSIEKKIVISLQNNNFKTAAIYDMAKINLLLIKNLDFEYLFNCTIPDLIELENNLLDLNNYFEKLILKEKQ